MKRGLAGVLARQTAALCRYARRAPRGDSHAVHQARVASRRLREALPIALDAAGASRRLDARADVRRVTRALGPVRELDVTLHELDAGAATHDWPAQAVLQVHEQLAEAREARAGGAIAKLDRVDLKRLRERCRLLEAACDIAPPAGWQNHVGARLRKRGRRFGQALRAVGTLYVPDPIHRVRIAGKKLRYTLELARAAAGAPVGREIATLKRLQDLLGRLRDLQVLQGHIREAATETTDAASRAGLDRIERDLDAECRTLHAKFLAGLDRWQRLADRAAREIPAAVTARRKRRMARARDAASRRARRGAA